MKYQKGKIKSEHHIMEEFEDFLREVEKLEMVKRIIPGRIKRQQKGTSQKFITISYYTSSGLKLNMKKGATAQEIFVLCDLENKEILSSEISTIISMHCK